MELMSRTFGNLLQKNESCDILKPIKKSQKKGHSNEAYCKKIRRNSAVGSADRHGADALYIRSV
jgi:hypothetical protein